ncbi:MAG: EthD domain-containing protein [Parahaliea sp.]
MAGAQIKMVTLLRRKPGLSLEEFIELYENGHRLIGERYLRGHASRYVRRFLRPLQVPGQAEVKRDYDVVMEIWFPDQAAYESAMAAISAPAAAQEIAEDEARLFDRDGIHSFTVEEYESDM